MRVVVFLVLCCVSVWYSHAQSDSVSFETMGLRLHVKPTGEVGKDKSDNPAFELFTHPDKHLLNYLSSWSVGLSNDTIFANRNIGQGRSQLWPGPIDTVTILAKDPVEWSKLWIVTRAEVDSHLLHYNETNYVMPAGIADWPARHATTNVSPYLAPFVDANGNGTYDPENGDYPSIKGDYNAYFISNDIYGENVFETSNKLGIETQGMLYAFEDALLENVLFLQLFLVNRTTRNYAPFYYGTYLDFKLGNASDNIVATDVTRNLFMGVNGDSQDEGVEGFGSDKPGLGFVYLNKNVFATCAFKNADTMRQIPATKEAMRHVMEGKWGTGAAKRAFKTGTETTGDITRFIYPGTSDANIAVNWTDKSSGEGVGQRSGLSVVRYASFSPKSFIQVNAAIIATATGSNVTEVLSQQADVIRAFYDQNLNVPSFMNVDQLNVYPNPLNISQKRSLNLSAQSVSLYNSYGKKIAVLERDLSEENKFKIPCNVSLPTGVYLLDAKTELGHQMLKLMIVSD